MLRIISIIPPKAGTSSNPPRQRQIRDSILALHPDVIALQEMGEISALTELRESLKAQGLDLSYWEHITGSDTNIHLAVLSRFPFTARRPHTNETFLLSGRRFHVSRGFAEVDIKVNPHYSFTLLTAHLKSKRPIPEADEAEERLQEARCLREIIDADLEANPDMNLIVLGDLNDTKDSHRRRKSLAAANSNCSIRDPPSATATTRRVPCDITTRPNHLDGVL